MKTSTSGSSLPSNSFSWVSDIIITRVATLFEDMIVVVGGVLVASVLVMFVLMVSVLVS